MEATEICPEFPINTKRGNDVQANAPRCGKHIYYRAEHRRVPVRSGRDHMHERRAFGAKGPEFHRRIGDCDRSERAIPCLLRRHGISRHRRRRGGTQFGRGRDQAPREMEWQTCLLRRWRPRGLSVSLHRSVRLRRGARARLRDCDYRHRSHRQEPVRRGMDSRRAGQAQRSENRGLFLSLTAPGDRRGQTSRDRVLRRAKGLARVFRRLFVRGPHGSDGSNALPRRLRWRHCRRSLYG